jgi:hypothetical protein
VHRGITGPSCSGGYKYRDLALQVGGVSNERVKYGHELGGPWPGSDYAGADQKQLYETITDPSCCQRGRPTTRKPPLSDEMTNDIGTNKNLVETGQREE